MNETTKPNELNVKQVAALLGKDGSTIRRWVERGIFGDGARRDGFGPTCPILIQRTAVRAAAEQLKIEIEI